MGCIWGARSICLIILLMLELLSNRWPDNSDNDLCWFAMSAPFRRELDAQKLLDEMSIESFIPMAYKVIMRKGKKKREWCPVVSNLIFVHATRKCIQEVKTYRIPFLQYLTKSDEGRNLPLVVPNNQMEQFMRASQIKNEKIVYLTAHELDRLGTGVRVRILGGPFDGIEGVFQRVQGCRSKRVVVVLQGILAIVLSEICLDLLEVLE